MNQNKAEFQKQIGRKQDEIQVLEEKLAELKRLGDDKRQELSSKIQVLEDNLQKSLDEKMSEKIRLMQEEQEQIVESLVVALVVMLNLSSL